jgi:hypothetical protein
MERAASEGEGESCSEYASGNKIAVPSGEKGKWEARVGGGSETGETPEYSKIKNE